MQWLGLQQPLWNMRQMKRNHRLSTEGAGSRMKLWGWPTCPVLPPPDFFSVRDEYLYFRNYLVDYFLKTKPNIS